MAVAGESRGAPSDLTLERRPDAILQPGIKERIPASGLQVPRVLWPRNAPWKAASERPPQLKEGR